MQESPSGRIVVVAPSHPLRSRVGLVKCDCQARQTTPSQGVRLLLCNSCLSLTMTAPTTSIRRPRPLSHLIINGRQNSPRPQFSPRGSVLHHVQGVNSAGKRPGKSSKSGLLNGRSPLPNHVQLPSPQPLNTPTQVEAIRLAGIAMQSPLVEARVKQKSRTPANSPSPSLPRVDQPAEWTEAHGSSGCPSECSSPPAAFRDVAPRSAKLSTPSWVPSPGSSMAVMSPFYLNSPIYYGKGSGLMDEISSPGTEYLFEKPSEGAPRSGIVGGVVSNLLKMFVRRKMDFCGKLHVAIGGSSLQLLSGRTTGFRIYMQRFSYENCLVAEAEAQTLPEAGRIDFNLSSARNGGKLLTKRVPMKMSIRVRESGATSSIAENCNKLLRETLHECWNHMNGRNVKLGEACQPDSTQPPLLPLPLFRVTFVDGLALYEEIIDNELKQSEGHKEPARMALQFKIEIIDGYERLKVMEARWPHADSTTPKHQVGEHREKWFKIMDLPPDIRFKNFTVEKGWLSCSYAFDLDL